MGLAVRSVLGTPRGLSFALSLVGFLKKVRLFLPLNHFRWLRLLWIDLNDEQYDQNNTIVLMTDIISLQNSLSDSNAKLPGQSF